MKVLHFLLLAEKNLFAQSIIDYLLDAGHFVDVISDENIQSWRPHYNLMSVTPKEVKEHSKKYNYCINLIENECLNICTPRIFFYLSQLENLKYFIKIQCFQLNEVSIIEEKIIDLNELNSSLLYEKIADVFIDSVIFLSKNSSLKFGEIEKDYNNLFYTLMNYDNQLKLLKNHYEISLGNLDLFDIDFNMSPTTIYSEEIVEIFNVDLENLEILAASVLFQLNARQSGVYCYDYKHNNLIISKFIFINESSNYNDLLNNINNKVYTIVNNAFYCEYSLGLNKPKFLIAVDTEIFSQNYSIIFEYSTQKEQLIIKYDNKIYYCQKLKSHIHSFFTNYKKFKEKKQSFYDFILEISQEIIPACYPFKAIDFKYKKITQLFEEQARINKKNIAVVYENTRLTYEELNHKANQLAHYLLSIHLIKKDDLIVLFLNRNEYMLITILAVLKSGGAYVPMDPDYPLERIISILKEVNPKVILTNEVYQDKFSTLIGLDNVKVIIKVESVDSEEIEKKLSFQSMDNLELISAETDLAYVIYTSGTTNKPKGVMIEHQSLINLSLIQGKEFGLSSYKFKNCLFYSNYIFDGQASDIFTPLVHGHTLHIINNSIRLDTDLLQNYISKNNISLAYIPPALLNVDCLFSLETLIVAGEKTKKSVLDAYCNQGTKIINAYGPTESTVSASLHHYKIGDLNTNIGKPLKNIQLYVLDNHLNPLPVGVVGELYIGGVGLARGYLNQPEMTVERFIDNPFQTEAEKLKGINVRLYKTGDLVSYLPTEDLEFIGRNDTQIKIRGYRIELSEIEEVLFKSNSAIQQAVVVFQKHIENPEKGYLVGYYVSSEALDESSLFDYLKSHLPEYMLPRVLCWLSQLPLTRNGKLDRSALPLVTEKKEEHYVQPHTEMEKKVCEIFSKVLGIPIAQIGIQDDFFRLGGDSISAIKLVNQLATHFSIKLSIADLFQHTTIEALLDCINRQNNKMFLIPKLNNEVAKNCSLSFAQERIWFIEQYEGGSDAYNTPIVLPLKSETKPALLIKAIESTISRHEILRTLIKTDNEGRSFQCIMGLSEKPIEIGFLSMSKEECEAFILQEAHHIFRLEKEYPIRAFVLKEKETGNHWLCLVIHHIAFDGWSINIFFDDVEAYYRFEEAKLTNINLPAILPNLSIQYKDFAVWQRDYFTDERLLDQMLYWRKLLADYTTLSFPTDKTRPQQICYEGEEVVFSLKKEISEGLRALAKQLKISLYNVLLSGYYLFLRSYSGQDDVIVGTPMATRHHAQLENLIGCFVNILPLRSQISEELYLINYLQSVSKDVMEAQLHQDLPFEKLVSQLNVPSDASRHPIFQILFNMQDHSFDTNNRTLFNPYAEAMRQSIAKFDLTVTMDDSQQQLKGVFNYATSLFTVETVERLCETYQYILEQLSMLSSNSQIKVRDLQYLQSPAYQQIIYNWNETQVNYLKCDTLVSLFQAQVRQYPEKEALVFEEISLTYRELNERANQVGNFLRRVYGVGPDDLVTLYLDRSEHLVIGLLGILKAGGAYVPLDPDYPVERVRYILEETKTRVILTQASLVSSLKEVTTQESLILDSDFFSVESKENLTLLSNPEHLAYVIYTSGTTGRPKGVMIEHSQAVSFLNSIESVILDTSSSNNTWLSSTNIVFDISFLEIIGALLSGLKVVLLESSALEAMQSISHVEKPINFGLFYFGNYADSQKEKETKYKLFIEGSKFADHHDFTFVSTPERHFDIFGGLYPNPTVTSAAISTITERIQIRTGSLVLPLHNPIRVAEDFALIDNLSQGRVCLSLATGWNKNDYTLMPENFLERREILFENLAILRKLWSGESVDVVGVDSVPYSVKTFPRPIQQELPVWLTIANNIESFEQAGQMGVNVLTHLLGQSVEELAEKIKLYKKALSQSPHSEENKQITLMIHTFVTSDEKYALDQVKEPFKKYLKTSIDLLKKAFPEKRVDNLDIQEMDMLLEQAFERYYYTSGLFGTPQSCQKMIDKLKEIGVTEIACLIDFGIEDSIVLDNLKYLNQLRLLSQPTSTNKITNIIKHHQVTHMQLTPSLGQMIFKPENRESLKSIQKVLMGGERLSVSLAEQIKESTSASLYHMYGPTETTVWSTYNLVKNNQEKMVIGKALSNELMYVLNNALHPVPLGAIGELYIGGMGLARGYLNQHEITLERFIENPFQTEEEKRRRVNGRLYKTGDLVRYLSNGDLEFIRRNDTQIKLRGYRIELNEIEEVLLKSNVAIQQTVIVLQKNNEDSEQSYLVGYYVSSEELDESILFDFLKSHLPNYMIPRALLWLSQLPLTRNGKLDHSALPHITEKKGEDYIAPRNDIEKKVCAIFADVLKVDCDQVGIRNDFFQLGGDSILAIRLVNQLATQASIKISILDLFQHKTIEAIAMETPQKNIETILIPRIEEIENK